MNLLSTYSECLKLNNQGQHMCIVNKQIFDNHIAHIVIPENEFLIDIDVNIRSRNIISFTNFLYLKSLYKSEIVKIEDLDIEILKCLTLDPKEIYYGGSKEELDKMMEVYENKISNISKILNSKQ